MWWLKFGLGIVCGWLIISPAFWRIIFREVKWIFSHKKQKVIRCEPQEYIKKSPEVVKVKTETVKDFSQMSKEEITELLRNSEVRVAHK
jgi:uncharacterized membrane protein YhiD involved in acid resistance